ncbi:MAG: ATP-binding protein [Alphaproteobacteria bacterium]|nr:ATP-binding protein [Alphaproteobacteria bacterium]
MAKIGDDGIVRRALHFFDEFDAAGLHRTAPDEVAELRRVFNSFLQFMEASRATHSGIVCATIPQGFSITRASGTLIRGWSSTCRRITRFAG